MNDLEEKSVGEMKKRRVMMADGKRYLIYYTFDDSESTTVASDLTVEKTENNENV